MALPPSTRRGRRVFNGLINLTVQERQEVIDAYNEYITLPLSERQVILEKSSRPVSLGPRMAARARPGGDHDPAPGARRHAPHHRRRPDRPFQRAGLPAADRAFQRVGLPGGYLTEAPAALSAYQLPPNCCAPTYPVSPFSLAAE